MGKFEAGNKTGHRFNSNNQPKGRGRKPGVYKQVAAILGEKFNIELRKSDFLNIQQMLLEMPMEKLKRIVKDPETPSFMVVHISAIMSDTKNGQTNSVERIYDRLFGRAMQPVEMEANIEMKKEYDLSAYTDEELEQIATLIEKTKTGNDDQKQDQEDTRPPVG